MSLKNHDAASEKLRAENEELRRRLAEAEDALRAIREGEVDAIVVSGTKGDRVFSLAESENLHRIMVETMNEAGMATSLDGTILYCNQRACALLQHAASELMGLHLSEIVAMQHLERVSLLLDNASRGTTHDRIMFLAADDSPVPMQLWASRAETADGPMISLVGTDLSLLEADQALLAHLEEQQNALQAREQELMVAHDRLSSDLEVMKSLQRIASQYVRGENPASIAGDALDAAIRASNAFSGDVQLFNVETGQHYIAAHRGFEPWRVEFWERALHTGTSSCKTSWESASQVVVDDAESSPLFAGTPELEAHRRAGVRCIVSTPMVSRAGRVLGVVTVHFKQPGAPDARTMRWIDLIARETGDILDRSHTETDLRRRREELETLFNESPAAIMIAHDVACTQITRNAEALRIFGPGGGGADGPGRRLLHRAIASAGAYREDEMEFEIEDGEPVIVAGGAAPLFDADGHVRGAVAVFNDITAHMQARQDLRRALVRRDELVEALQQAQRVLKESHLDLEVKVKERTLLSEERGQKLRVMADALTTAEQDERRRLAQVLHDDLQQMLIAIRLRLSNLESTVVGTSLTPAVKGIAEIVDNAITSSRSLTLELSPPVLRESFAYIIEWLGRWFETRHEIAVNVHVEPNVPEPSDEAKKYLFQAVRELILNIRKHAGVDEARVRIFPAGEHVGIEVSDSGKGFDPEHIKSSGRVTFGLFNIRERVELMGGSLEIKSVPGHGTTCVIQMPASGAVPKPVPVEPVTGVAAPVDESGPIRVLVVDDHTIFRRGLISILESHADIKVVGEASDGEQGVKQAGELIPDVVIMDLAMPRMNGIEATRVIKSRFQSVDVIALSFQESEHARASILQAGARAYFTKSGPLDNLLQAIREHVRGNGKPAGADNGHPSVVPSARPREHRRANAPLREKVSDKGSSPRSRKA
jgi:PAS domain S-box-containing protein